MRRLVILLASAGYALEHEYERVEAWLDPVSWTVLGALVAAYSYRAFRLRSRRRAEAAQK